MKKIILIILIIFLIINSGCIENNSDFYDKNSQIEIKTGFYSNENMTITLLNEAEAIKNKYLSSIYPSPSSIPEKLLCIFLPRPQLWKEGLLRIDELKNLGFNSVQLCLIMSVDSNDHPYSAGEDLLKFYINEFHRNGMHVVLTTNPAGPWGNYFSQDSSEQIEQVSDYVKNRRKNGSFVDEYVEQILNCAKLAQEFQTKAFIPANEMQLISINHSYVYNKTAEILPNLKQRFNGLIGINMQNYGHKDEEYNWEPLYWQYNLTGYDFILSMGETANINSETREIYKDHIRKIKNADISYLRDLADKFNVEDIWFGFVIFNGSGNYWEPITNDLNKALNAYEAAEYLDLILDIIYENVTCVTPNYDVGFYIFDEPLLEMWQKYFPVNNIEPHSSKSWTETELDIIEECLFPEWDALYTIPWGDNFKPGATAYLFSNDNISINGIATYECPNIILINHFSFQAINKDIEIRLADYILEDEILVNIARLIDIGFDTYQNATLTLYWPDYLTEIMSQVQRKFTHLIIYDVENREILGKYEFQQPN